MSVDPQPRQEAYLLVAAMTMQITITDAGAISAIKREALSPMLASSVKVTIWLWMKPQRWQQAIYWRWLWQRRFHNHCCQVISASNNLAVVGTSILASSVSIEGPTEM
jgi:hypothetical protein